jgi:cleavage and polyadenylation specificity factor subunit 3
MPAHLILVHGEANNMSRLRSALKTKFAERKDDIQIYTPRNVETVKLKFRGERMAKVRWACWNVASSQCSFASAA